MVEFHRLPNPFPDHVYRSMRAVVTAGVIILLANVFTAARVHASAVPWTTDKPVRVTVKDQSLPELLRAIVMENRIPVVISDSVKGNVSGSFQRPLDQLMDDLSGSFGFTWFYDGHVIYIDSLADSSTKVVALSSDRFARMQEVMAQLGIDGKKFSMRWLSSENSIVVSGPPKFLQAIEDLAAVIEHSHDRPNSPLDVRVFRLKHAWAKDISLDDSQEAKIIPGVATLLKQIMAAHTGEGGDDPGGESSWYSPNSGEKNPGKTGGALSSYPLLPLGGKPGPKGGEAEHAKQKQTPPPNFKPNNSSESGSTRSSGGRSGGTRSGKPTIEADPRINAIIVRDTRDRMSIYETLIKDLDMPVDLVEIEATVIDLDMDKSDRGGVTWRFFANGHLDTSVGEGRQILTNNSGANLANSGFSPGSPNAGVLGNPADILSSVVVGSSRNFFAATIDALVRNGHARIVTSPRILTLDNIEAVLENQRTFHVRVAGQYEANLFPISAGMTLKVTPRIMRNGDKTSVKLLVMIEDGTLSQAQVDQIPIVARKNINTQAVIDAGDSLLIGGYIVDESLNDASQVPLLGEIPVVGALFRHNTERNRRVERMLLITPRIHTP